MTFFVGLHLILRGKLDVERREGLFFLVFTDIFSRNGNRKLRPSLLKFLGTPLTYFAGGLTRVRPTLGFSDTKSLSLTLKTTRFIPSRIYQ